eukprot:206737-Chlamydomonas_euryale.AAC.3
MVRGELVLRTWPAIGLRWLAGRISLLSPHEASVCLAASPTWLFTVQFTVHQFVLQPRLFSTKPRLMVWVMPCAAGPTAPAASGSPHHLLPRALHSTCCLGLSTAPAASGPTSPAASGPTAPPASQLQIRFQTGFRFRVACAHGWSWLVRAKAREEISERTAPGAQRAGKSVLGEALVGGSKWGCQPVGAQKTVQGSWRDLFHQVRPHVPGICNVLQQSCVSIACNPDYLTLESATVLCFDRSYNPRNLTLESTLLDPSVWLPHRWWGRPSMNERAAARLPAPALLNEAWPLVHRRPHHLTKRGRSSPAPASLNEARPLVHRRPHHLTKRGRSSTGARIT